jgi:hypothetical protein
VSPQIVETGASEIMSNTGMYRKTIPAAIDLVQNTRCRRSSGVGGFCCGFDSDDQKGLDGEKMLRCLGEIFWSERRATGTRLGHQCRI